MTDPRLNIQSGPFKGKPQQWFTRAEVIALLENKTPATVDLFGDGVKRPSGVPPSHGAPDA